MANALRFSLLVATTVLLAITTTGCATSTSTAASENSRLDGYKIAALMPTSAEVKKELGWSEKSSGPATNLSSLPKDVDSFISAYGSSLSLSKACTDAIRTSGALPTVPVGAVAAAASEWVERNVTVRDLLLTRYRSTAVASRQVSGLPAVIKACPPFSVEGQRKIEVVSSSLTGAIVIQASDSYSWVIASYGDLVAQVEVGNSDAERASGEALVKLQLDKLKRIAAGTYK